MSVPKTQREYFELSHADRAKVPSETLIMLLGEDTSADDKEDEDLYYPLSEAFDAMSEAERVQMSKEDKLKILNETPQKREKKK